MEKKGKGALIISIIIFCICICATIYIAKNRVTPSKIINKVQKNIKIEVDISDTSIKKDLSNKIDYLLYGKEINTNYISIYDLRRGDESLNGDVFNDLDNETKLRVILDFLNYSNKFTPQKIKVTGIEDVDSTIRFVGLDSVKQINSSEVEKYYKVLFGDTEYKLEDSKGCLGYYYDEKNSLYYVIDQNCESSSDTNVYIYKTNYRKHENQAFVDVYFGYVKQDNNTNIIYRDYNLTRTVDKEDFDINSKLINDDNYNEFEHFRFNFQLDSNNNYYFTSISN